MRHVDSTPSAPESFTTRLRTVGWLISYAGVSSLIAGWLVYWGSKTLPDILKEQILIHAAVLENKALLMEHEQHDAELYRMLQRICSNTAKSSDERQRCFDK